MKAIKNLLGKKVIVRSYGAGMFFGTLNEVEVQGDKLVVELLKCRRLWYWEGAFSCTQPAIDGTKNPSRCNFTQTIDSIVISSVIEILPAWLIKRDPENYGFLAKRSAAERRAEYLGRAISGAYDATTLTGRILQKIKDLIDVS